MTRAAFKRISCFDETQC